MLFMFGCCKLEIDVSLQGWKLSDMMFVTNRGLSDACKTVGSQLDQVSDSVIVSYCFTSARL